MHLRLIPVLQEENGFTDQCPLYALLVGDGRGIQPNLGLEGVKDTGGKGLALHALLPVDLVIIETFREVKLGGIEMMEAGHTVLEDEAHAFLFGFFVEGVLLCRCVCVWI